MRRAVAAIFILACMCPFNSAHANCPDGQLQFLFSNLRVREAFETWRSENGVLYVSRK